MRLSLPAYLGRLSRARDLRCRGLGGCVSSTWFSTTTTSAHHTAVVDLRSDTVTQPSRPMLEAALSAPTGDDVLGEDPTVQELEATVADRLGKAHGLFVPSGTMANLVALMAHCHTRAAEIIIGAGSHICLWEGGGAAGLAGVHTRQLPEDAHTAQFDVTQLQAALRHDDDDHFPQTRAICLENTHNLLGGRALPVSYLQAVKEVAQAHGDGVAVHVDGARIFNAAAAMADASSHVVSAADLVAPVDSISVCLSKGLGAPAGSVLVSSDAEFLRLARRARKRCGGGLRQAGVVAAMGLYAVQHHVQRLVDDHQRARQLADRLQAAGFVLPGVVDTNIVYFGLPAEAVAKYSGNELTHVFVARLGHEYGVKLSGGYVRSGGGGPYFRAVTHLDVTDEQVIRAADAMIQLAANLAKE